jgi:hypothetical protein
MDDFAKVEAAAHANDWIEVTTPLSAPMAKYMKSRSMWTVTQGDEKFQVSIWVSLIGEDSKLPSRKVCAVTFQSKNVKRDEFFSLVSASMDLKLAFETKFPQMRSESYEVKSGRPDKIHFSLTSMNDGTVTMALMQEMHTFGAPRPAPATPPAVDR